jgi:hypothetical protein
MGDDDMRFYCYAPEDMYLPMTLISIRDKTNVDDMAYE